MNALDKLAESAQNTHTYTQHSRAKDRKRALQFVVEWAVINERRTTVKGERDCAREAAKERTFDAGVYNN